MHISKIKNALIIILLVAAVYQTGKLWLGDMAGHNFFYTVISVLGQEKRAAVEEGDILLPGRFSVGKGNRKFSVFYPSGETGAEIMEKSGDLIAEIIAQGAYSGIPVAPDWEKIQTGRCILFQYDFLSPMNTYIGSAPKNGNTGQMTHFDSIGIIPAKNNSEETTVYFINSKTDQSVYYTMNNSRYAVSLYSLIDSAEDGLMYVSTAQSGFKIFESNVFVPQWAESEYNYPILKKEMPFEKDGVISRGQLENSINGFFRNFAADWSEKDTSGAYVFSDESIVVKYYPEGILEYYNYGSYDEDKSPGLLEGYQICRSFLQRDKALETDVYLSYVRIRSNEIIYYFDYHVNHFPVVFSDALRRKTAAEHGVELVVRDDSVRKYRRYACNFEEQAGQTGQVTVDFLAALNNSILEYQAENDAGVVTEVGDVYLAYVADVTESVSLKWFTELYGQIFMQDTVSPQQ